MPSGVVDRHEQGKRLSVFCDNVKGTLSDPMEEQIARSAPRILVLLNDLPLP
jgi:hypothetical protein